MKISYYFLLVLFTISLASNAQELYVPGGPSNINDSGNNDVQVWKGNGYSKLALTSDGDGTHNNSPIRITAYGYGGSQDLIYKILNWSGNYIYTMNSSGGSFAMARITKGGAGASGPNSGYGVFDIYTLNQEIGISLKGSGSSFINSSNLGIGLTDPVSELHVKGTTTLQNTSDGGVLMRLETARPWEFKQIGTGANTHLELFSTVDNKNFIINTTGGVGIGTNIISGHKLSVNGTIRAKEVKVETGWSDFVFEEDYQLRSLSEVESFIQENGHLPDIPSAEEVAENGVNVGEMESKLLQKIEELTLYMIEQEKRIERLEEENKELRNKKSQIK